MTGMTGIVIILCASLILAIPAIIIYIAFIIIKAAINYSCEEEKRQQEQRSKKEQEDKERKEQRLKERKQRLSEVSEIIEIDVEKSTQDEVFNLYHRECYGGKIEEKDFEFKCQRCTKKFCIPHYQKALSFIAQTAIDGKQREFDAYDSYYKDKREKLFKVVLNKKALKN